ncbi:hypothetical protein WQO_10330 [Streptomyces globisporus C-1027]|uniref:Uncharacterized protein n=1 Tax=Streptomyces globisporus C-1027 TaxID=1172567 RepID=A0A0U2SUK4_STRGL|nr:hypothetical protein [Streptomyces globisporus]ALU93712.1 hypothetical protein WQO_10330 [Streptomyces globisporus C-1027]
MVGVPLVCCVLVAAVVLLDAARYVAVPVVFAVSGGFEWAWDRYANRRSAQPNGTDGPGGH